MSIHQAAVASRQSHIARKHMERDVPVLELSVNEYTAAEADEIVRQAQHNPKVARRFLSHINGKQSDGWRLDKFHRQLRELCAQTLHNDAARRAEAQRRRQVESFDQALQEFESTYRVTPHAATMMH